MRKPIELIRRYSNAPREQASGVSVSDGALESWKEFRKFAIQRQRDEARLRFLETGDNTDAEVLLMREEARLNEELAEMRKRGRVLGAGRGER